MVQANPEQTVPHLPAISLNPGIILAPHTTCEFQYTEFAALRPRDEIRHRIQVISL